jgi:hypothetical protein
MSDSPIAIPTGGCQCGACRYALTAAPERVPFCHCRNCQPTPLITPSRIPYLPGSPAVDDEPCVRIAGAQFSGLLQGGTACLTASQSG